MNERGAHWTPREVMADAFPFNRFKCAEGEASGILLDELAIENPFGRRCNSTIPSL
jgi:hypothetical protein